MYIHVHIYMNTCIYIYEYMYIHRFVGRDTHTRGFRQTFFSPGVWHFHPSSWLRGRWGGLRAVSSWVGGWGLVTNHWVNVFFANVFFWSMALSPLLLAQKWVGGWGLGGWLNGWVGCLWILGSWVGICIAGSIALALSSLAQRWVGW